MGRAQIVIIAAKGVITDMFYYLFIYLFIYFWLHWIFVAAHRLSLVAASGGELLFSAVCGLLIAVASLVA